LFEHGQFDVALRPSRTPRAVVFPGVPNDPGWDGGDWQSRRADRGQHALADAPFER